MFRYEPASVPLGRAVPVVDLIAAAGRSRRDVCSAADVFVQFSSGQPSQDLRRHLGQALADHVTLGMRDSAVGALRRTTRLARPTTSVDSH